MAVGQHKTISILLFSFFLAFQSCYTVQKTHSEAMDDLLNGATKQDVLKMWGVPSEKRTEGRYAEWIYDFGSRYITRSYGSTMYTFDANAYIKVQFYGDRVTDWKTRGVNYERTKTDKGRTAIAAIIITSATIGLGILCGKLLSPY